MIKAVVDSPFAGRAGDTVYLTFDGKNAGVLDTASDQLVAYGRPDAPLLDDHVSPA